MSNATPARLLSLLLALPLAAAPLWAGEPDPKSTPFTKEVLTHFAQWDADQDGQLEANELDALVDEPSITGDAAAAVGALKSVLRSGKYDAPILNIEFFRRYEADVAAKKPVSPNFDRSFTRNARRIKATKRDLFTDGIPSLETCHQGPLGDCFFVSVVGAAVSRDHEQVKSMIRQNDDGTITVTFGNNKSVQIPMLTDIEISLTSTTGDDGVWLAVLEKAYGKLRNDALPADKQRESTTDAIAKGGSTSTTIRALTGHNTDRISFRPKPPAKPKDAAETPKDTTTSTPAEAAPAVPAAPLDRFVPNKSAAKPAIIPDPDAAAWDTHLAETLPKVREKLTAAFQNHRLVALGTASNVKLPPGINGKHAYAVLGYDKDTDTLHIWNPHGNSYTPKGDEGLTYGYKTKAGRFDVPLQDVARIFSGITLENSDPAPAR